MGTTDGDARWRQREGQKARTGGDSRGLAFWRGARWGCVVVWSNGRRREMGPEQNATQPRMWAGHLRGRVGHADAHGAGYLDTFPIFCHVALSPPLSGGIAGHRPELRCPHHARFSFQGVWHREHDETLCFFQKKTFGYALLILPSQTWPTDVPPPEHVILPPRQTHSGHRKDRGSTEATRGVAYRFAAKTAQRR